MRETQRRARELLGWSILTTVATLSRLAMWIDSVSIHDDESAQ